MPSVQEQVELKMKLENMMKPGIKRIFSVILKDFRTSVGMNEQPVDSNRYLGAWADLLDTHYRRVQKAFTDVIKSVKQIDDEDSEEEILAMALLAWREQNVGKRSNWLSETTRANMSEAIRLAREEFAAEGVVPTRRQLALAATAILRKKFASRIDRIAMSETQTSSESTKFTQAEVGAGITPRALGGGAVLTDKSKTWRTMRDKKVRSQHKQAEGQIKPLTQPFVVANEFLMYPGDSSMGASISNVANCRCVAVYGGF